jgi:hypothetical protein
MGVRVKGIEGDHGSLLFFCPGCGCGHRVFVSEGDRPRPVWGYNGNPERPTLTPSVLVNGNVPINPPHTHRCHSFVIDGKIQFLGDCTHALAGQTVDLPEVDRD